MRYETFSSNVKRLNQRIVQTAKSFGKDSPLYKEYEAKIEKMIPSDFINVNKRGEIQISRSKKLYEYGGQTYVQKQERLLILENRLDYHFKKKSLKIK